MRKMRLPKPSAATVIPRTHTEQDKQKHRNISPKPINKTFNSHRIYHIICLTFLILTLFSTFTCASATQKNAQEKEMPSIPESQKPIICDKENPIHIWEIPNDSKCQTNPQENATELIPATQELWKLNLKSENSEITLCAQILSTLTFRQTRTKRILYEAEHLPTSAEFCNKIAKNNATQNGQYLAGAILHYSSPLPTKLAFKGPEVQHTFQHVHILRHVPFITTHNNFVSPAINISACTYANGQCKIHVRTNNVKSPKVPTLFKAFIDDITNYAQRNDAILIRKGKKFDVQAILTWTVNPDINCQYIPLQKVTGEFGPDGFLASSQTLFFNYKLPFETKTVTCPKYNNTLYKTEQGNWIKFLEPNERTIKQILQGTYIPRMTVKDNRGMKCQLQSGAATAAQLQYLSKMSKERNLQVYHTLLQINCKLYNSNLITLRTMLPVSGTKLARLILKHPHIIASATSKHLIVFPCTIIDEFNMVPQNQSCFDKPSINATWNKRSSIGFLDTVTMQVQDHANIIPCNTRHVYYITINNKIYAYKQDGSFKMLHNKISILEDQLFSKDIFNFTIKNLKFKPTNDINITQLLPSESLVSFYNAMMKQQRILTSITSYSNGDVLTKKHYLRPNKETYDYINQLLRISVSSMFNMQFTWLTVYQNFAATIVYSVITYKLLRFIYRVIQNNRKNRPRFFRAFSLAWNYTHTQDQNTPTQPNEYIDSSEPASTSNTLQRTNNIHIYNPINQEPRTPSAPQKKHTS